MAIRDDKVMQDFKSQSFLIGATFPNGEDALTRNDCGSKDYVNLSSPIAVSRLKAETEFLSGESYVYYTNGGLSYCLVIGAVGNWDL
jgi:hypothetical protein